MALEITSVSEWLTSEKTGFRYRTVKVEEVGDGMTLAFGGRVAQQTGFTIVAWESGTVFQGPNGDVTPEYVFTPGMEPGVTVSGCVGEIETEMFPLQIGERIVMQRSLKFYTTGMPGSPTWKKAAVRACYQKDVNPTDPGLIRFMLRDESLKAQAMYDEKARQQQQQERVPDANPTPKTKARR
jgi:hypothetical protein